VTKSFTPKPVLGTLLRSWCASAEVAKTLRSRSLRPTRTPAAANFWPLPGLAPISKTVDLLGWSAEHPVSIARQWTQAGLDRSVTDRGARHCVTEICMRDGLARPEPPSPRIMAQRPHNARALPPPVFTALNRSLRCPIRKDEIASPRMAATTASAAGCRVLRWRLHGFCCVDPEHGTYRVPAWESQVVQ